MMWAQIEKVPGNPDFTAMDARMSREAGKAVNFVLFGTPQWAATPAHQTLANQAGTVWAYPSYKTAAAAVANPANAANFVKTVLNKYGQQIKYVEIWNEPTFDANTTKGSFYWGTVQQMKELAAAVNTAVKSIRPDVTVICPGFASSQDLRQFLAADGGAHCDAIAWHAYSYHSIQRTTIEDPRWLYEDVDPKNPTKKIWVWGHYSRDIMAPSEDADGKSITAVRAAADAQPSSKGKPLYLTEYGLGDNTSSDVYLSYRDTLSPSQQQVYYEQLFAEAAAAGVKQFTLYKYSNNASDDLAGGLMNPNSAVVKAMATIKTKLIDSGLGIVGTERKEGRLILNMSNNTRLEFGAPVIP